MKRPLILLAMCSLLTLQGCGEFDYYLQGVEGHMNMMQRSRQIPEILADPQGEQQLKDRLRLLVRIRDFASSHLLLPDNQSYRSYADLERDYVVWNVVATPEFSMTPVTWCFPVAGCVPYRGYFDEQAAATFADSLKEQHHDTLVYGVVAYSTLNWFDDPALNTFAFRSEADLAALVFHELAHQAVYLPGEAEFNEAFAKSVEMAGVKLWLEEEGDFDALEAYLQRQQIEARFIAMALEYQDKLQRLYASPRTDVQKRTEKASIIESFKERTRHFAQINNMVGRFDRWLAADLNNARFASLSTYYDLVPAFENLLRLHEGDLARFYRQVHSIANNSPEERSSVLQHLARAHQYGHLEQ